MKKNKITPEFTVTETDFSIMKTSDLTCDCSKIIGKSDKVPINEPLMIYHRIKPVKWYQFWRYRDIKKYKAEVERCKLQIKETFGEPDKINIINL